MQNSFYSPKGLYFAFATIDCVQEHAMIEVAEVRLPKRDGAC
jgi:hypothetical protein